MTSNRTRVGTTRRVEMPMIRARPFAIAILCTLAVTESVQGADVEFAMQDCGFQKLTSCEQCRALRVAIQRTSTRSKW